MVEVELSFDTRVVRLSALKKAAYRLSGALTVSFNLVGDGVTCRLKPSPGTEWDAAQVEHTFRTAALDQELREQIAEQTETLRNAVLSVAFAPLTARSAE